MRLRVRETSLVFALSTAAVALPFGCSIPDRSLAATAADREGGDAAQNDAGSEGAALSDASDGSQDARDVALPPVEAGSDDATAPMDGDAVADAPVPPPGALDPTFGGTGIVTIPSAGSLAPHGLAAQTDGSIVYCGTIYDSATQTNQLVLGRLTAAGIPDPAFVGGGRLVTLQGGYDNEVCSAVAISATGTIAVAGFVSHNDMPHAMLAARFTSSGGPDPTLGGFVPVVDTVDSKAASIAVQPDGKTVLAGFRGELPAIVRLQIDGTNDPLFDPSPQGDASIGVTTLANGGPNGEFAQLALLPSGKILAGVNDPAGSFVARFTSGGVLDDSYGNGGETPDAGATIACKDMIAQPDGKAVCVGSTPTAIVLTRFGTDGEPDSSFGPGGQVAVPAEGLTASSIALLHDGSFAIGVWSNLNVIGVAHVSANGALDTSFGTKGFHTIAAASSSSAAIAVDPDGRIVVGIGTVGDGLSVVLARFWP